MSSEEREPIEEVSSTGWYTVREKIYAIESGLDTLASTLDDVENADKETLSRLEALQARFEAVMSQLSQFDEETDHSIRLAKEEFREVVIKYRLAESKTKKHRN